MDALSLGCNLLNESFVYYAMDVLGYYGHAFVGVPLGLALIAVGYKRQNQHFKLAGVAVLLSIASAGILTEALKHIFQMPRPRSVASYAFPSGHSGTAFALASALSVSFPALTPLYFLLATFTAISRLYFRAHFLIDVIAGGSVGALTGYFITRRLVGRAPWSASSFTRRTSWFAVGAVACCAMAYFYAIETGVGSYRITEPAVKNISPGMIRFDFGTPEVRRVLGSGWSLDELWKDGQQSVVWAEGLRSEMSAQFPSPSGYRWRMNLSPYLGKVRSCQFVQVEINKTSVVKLLLEQGWHWYEFDVPAGVIRNGDNQVRFLFNYASTPKSYRISDDARRLSVAFDVLDATPQNLTADNRRVASHPAN
jgi:membrane-associated phospholipid phosphatase